MVTRPDVLHLAQLARLHLDDAEVDRLVPELSGILDHVDELGTLPIEKVDATGGAAEGAAPIRADEPGADALRERPSSFAPAWSDGLFTVPRLAAHDDGGGSDA